MMDPRIPGSIAAAHRNRYEREYTIRKDLERLGYRSDYENLEYVILDWKTEAPIQYKRVSIHWSEGAKFCEAHNCGHHEDEFYYKDTHDGEINCSTAMFTMLNSVENKECATTGEGHLRWRK